PIATRDDGIDLRVDVGRVADVHVAAAGIDGDAIGTLAVEATRGVGVGVDVAASQVVDVDVARGGAGRNAVRQAGVGVRVQDAGIVDVGGAVVRAAAYADGDVVGDHVHAAAVVDVDVVAAEALRRIDEDARGADVAVDIQVAGRIDVDVAKPEGLYVCM